MSRTILAIAGILFCSVSTLGQEFVIPQNNQLTPAKSSGFQPPSNSGFTPVQQEEAGKAEVIILPTKSVQQESDDLTPQSEVDTTKATIQQVPAQQPAVQEEPTQEEAVQEEAVQEKPVPENLIPTNNLSIQTPEPNVELPEPKKEIERVELKEDQQVYPSANSNGYGVSQYRLEVAREKARARRMRMEVKKWYGIDTARPTVAPRVNVPTYSAFYNGVYSRPAYNNSYGGYYQPNFYYHFSVGR